MIHHCCVLGSNIWWSTRRKGSASILCLCHRVACFFFARAASFAMSHESLGEPGIGLVGVAEVPMAMRSVRAINNTPRNEFNKVVIK